jgi:hypothetical protein
VHGPGGFKSSAWRARCRPTFWPPAAAPSRPAGTAPPGPAVPAPPRPPYPVHPAPLRGCGLCPFWPHGLRMRGRTATPRKAEAGWDGARGRPATSADAIPAGAGENNQYQDIQSPIALLHRDVNCSMPRTEQSELAGPLAAPPGACQTSSIASSKRLLATSSSAAGHALGNQMRSGSAYVEPDRRNLS